MGIEFNKSNALFFSRKFKPNVSTDGAAGKKDVIDVKAKQTNVDAEEKTTGLDVFVRENKGVQTNGADTLAALNKANIKRYENAQQVNTSPVATEKRLALALGTKAPEIAIEAGVDPAATVNGVSQEILNNINVSPLLAQYLNIVDSARVEQSMQQFLSMAS